MNLESKKIDDQESKGLTLLDLILVFLRWKKHILIFTLIVCIISIVLYFFVFDLIYFSSASVKSNAKSGSLLGGLEIPDVEDLGDFDLGTGKSAKELALFESILMSRRCLEELIIRFDLMDRDDYKYLEDAIKEFNDNKLVLDPDRAAGILNIGVYDKDPKLAKEMVEFLLQQLDKVNIEMNVASSRINREFIEKRYYQAKEDLTRAEDSLKIYQLIYGIAPDLQVKAAAQTAFEIEAELMSEEVKLDVLRKILSSDQPEVKTQEAKVNSLKSKVSEIQTSTNLNDLLRLGNSPQIVLSYLRLQRDIEIQTKILSFLLPIYEQAKIDEKRDTPTILVLDKPYISERKKKPKRLTMVLILTFSGFIIGFAGFAVYDKYKEIKFNIKTVDKQV